MPIKSTNHSNAQSILRNAFLVSSMSYVNKRLFVMISDLYYFGSSWISAKIFDLDYALVCFKLTVAAAFVFCGSGFPAATVAARMPLPHTD